MVFMASSMSCPFSSTGSMYSRAHTILFHAHNNHPGHVQPCSGPSPLAPYGLSFSYVAQEFGFEVRKALEHTRPVLADLLLAAKAPVGVGRLLTLVAWIEAL
jgi:hypothetical protein